MNSRKLHGLTLQTSFTFHQCLCIYCLCVCLYVSATRHLCVSLCMSVSVYECVCVCLLCFSICVCMCVYSACTMWRGSFAIITRLYRNRTLWMGQCWPMRVGLREKRNCLSHSPVGLWSHCPNDLFSWSDAAQASSSRLGLPKLSSPPGAWQSRKGVWYLQVSMAIVAPGEHKMQAWPPLPHG